MTLKRSFDDSDSSGESSGGSSVGSLGYSSGNFSDSSRTFPNDTPKRLQNHRIHSEAHIRTVQMLMQAQQQVQNEEPQTEEKPDTYRQKPYWY